MRKIKMALIEQHASSQNLFYSHFEQKLFFLILTFNDNRLMTIAINNDK